MNQKITTFLWFDNQAEEAANFYVSLFKDSAVTNVVRYGEAGPGTPGSVMVVNFRLAGQEYIALNGGPVYQLTPAISLYVDCESQAEVDELWDKLTDGGQPIQCGWLQDKYGLSWQIIPRLLTDLLQDEDRERADRVMQAMMQMVKIDVAELERAYRGG